MTVDTAAAGSNVGAPDVTGALPTDTLGPSPTPQPTGAQTSEHETSLDAYIREKSMAALNARYAGTTTTTTTTSGGVTVPTGAGIGAKIVAAAEHYLGVPYKWGGTGPGGVDCSGLVQLAYKAAGIDLPRISFQQANSGTRVKNLGQLRPGDLLAWDNSARNNGADHIAIYLGGGKYIEAPYPGAKVRIRTLGKDSGAWFIRMGWM